MGLDPRLLKAGASKDEVAEVAVVTDPLDIGAVVTPPAVLAATTPLPAEDKTLLSVAQLARVMPKNIKGKITEDLVIQINGLMVDQELRENFRDNLLSYTSVMQTGKYKIESYVDAVRYVSHKLMGSSNVEAYAKTFPDRIKRLTDEGADERRISAYVAAYNKNQLVNKIMEQTLIPLHVFNADIQQKAINRLASLMMTANSEKVQQESANSLLTHLKRPEVAKIELDIGIKKDKSIDELREATLALVLEQKRILAAGAMTIADIANSEIVINNDTGEVEDA